MEMFCTHKYVKTSTSKVDQRTCTHYNSLNSKCFCTVCLDLCSIATSIFGIACVAGGILQASTFILALIDTSHLSQGKWFVFIRSFGFAARDDNRAQIARESRQLHRLSLA